MLSGFIIGAYATLAIAAGRIVQFVHLGNENLTFSKDIIVYQGVRYGTCKFLCAMESLCIYASYHNDGRCCRLHGANATEIVSPGWTAIYKHKDENGISIEFDVMTGATAFQSSTNFDGLAENALDGDPNPVFIDGHCMHTGDYYSYWIMQFGMPGIVYKVHIHLRDGNVLLLDRNTNFDVIVSLNVDDAIARIGDQCGEYYGPSIQDPPYLLVIICHTPLVYTTMVLLLDRNTNFDVIVSLNVDDAIARIGDQCGEYYGPSIQDPPYLLVIKCQAPLYGRFLRISHDIDNYMDFCEVVVFVV